MTDSVTVTLVDPKDERARRAEDLFWRVDLRVLEQVEPSVGGDAPKSGDGEPRALDVDRDEAVEGS